ncbi:MAG: GMC oxidoreductase [Marmoricola sp.]
MAARIEIDDNTGLARGVVYHDEIGGEEKLQRARYVAVAGYSIETPRLLLASTSKRHPHGLGNNEDQVGRYVMVQGAAQTAGRFPMELRQYKAPPPEISSEQFYETDESRGFARGFSIQTVGPLPITWSKHVLADGHWGRAMREYMRDYNHWATIGVLNELLPHADNRVTLADVKDPYGLRVARFDYSVGENDQKNMDYSTKVITDILHASGAQDVLTVHRYAHLVGGCRMGTSPDSSVLDPDQRIWGVPNVFCSDGSVCPTQGSANPALTIMALASRLAERMASGEALHPQSAGRPRLRSVAG